MEDTLSRTEEPRRMEPPPIRPSARSEEVAPECSAQKQLNRTISQTREQISRNSSRNRFSQKRRQSEVSVPPFDTTKSVSLEKSIPKSTFNSPTTAWLDSTISMDAAGTRNVFQEVHKIILSDISVVEVFHGKQPQPPVANTSQAAIVPNNKASEFEMTHPLSEIDKTEDELTPRKLTPKCLYRVEYRDEDEVLVYEKEGNSAADIKLPQRLDEPVMEVITTIEVKKKSQSNNDKFNPELHKGLYQGTEVKINSPLLINALRAVVSYYPGESLFEEPLFIDEPYQFLVHHRKELEEYKDSHPPSHTPDYRAECNQHIDILLDFLRQCFDGGIELEEARHKQNPPKCTFEYLWMLFKPGVDVYTRGNLAPLISAPSVFVVNSIEGGHSEDDIKQTTIHMWDLHSRGDSVTRCASRATIPPFDGEMEITSLFAYPLSFMQEDERTALKERLIARGKRYYEYTAISHKMFYGYTMTTPRRLYDTRVILDTAEFILGNRLDALTLNTDYDNTIGVCGCSCDTCGKTKNTQGKTRFSGYDNIPLISSEIPGKLTDHQYLVCSPCVEGFALKQRSWQLLDMDAIHDITFEKENIDDLVLDPEENKSLLKALAKRYAQKPADIDILPPVIKNGVTVVGRNTNEPWAADFIEGKGEGQIILLHGPPGVGKTCTAESVAEFTERPLLSLSSSNIGDKASEVEINLLKYMKRARRWGAILLIDEADVYLEERTAQDFERNNLVSVFLRALEYYQGILFLTTNRVGVFDEAFASRIHISIWYPGFDDIKRIKVWKSMIARLKRERKDIKVPYDLNKYIEKDEDLRRVEWNGREIRNAFQTVVALAEYHAAEEKSAEVEVKIEHLDQVVKMSKRFKEYLTTLPEGNVSKKALRHGKRNDEFGNR